MGVSLAALHPGRVLQCFDHFVIDLHGEGGQAAYFTVYAVEYSPELGTGHVAFLRTREADGQELDLVLDRTVLAEGENGVGFRWPIVHYARPEIDITDDLIQRLNASYGPRKTSDE